MTTTVQLAVREDAPAARSRAADVALPERAEWLWRGFNRYGRWYLRRHFHSVRLARDVPPALRGQFDGETTTPRRPLLVYLNHPAWWDPMIGLVLADRLFASRRHFAPIEDAALGKYRFFERLGFFGIDPTDRRGAERFLRLGEAILQRADRMLWVTAQGRFADVRDRPLNLKPGVAHLARRMSRAASHPDTSAPPPPLIVPLALEYTHWTERLPEALAMFGEPIDLATVARDPFDPTDLDDWQQLLTRRLEQAMDDLAALSIERDAERFTALLTGGAGVGLMYDLYRRIKAACTGKRFEREHGGA